MYAGLGRFAVRRRWWVVAAWAAVLVAGLAGGGGLFDRLQPAESLRPDAESVRAQARVEALVDDGPVVFAVIAGVDPYDPALGASIGAISADIRTIPGVVDATDLYTGPGGAVGAGGRSTLVRVEFAEGLAEPELEAAEDQVRVRLKAIAAPTVLIGGDHLAERAFGEQAIDDLIVGESVAFALLLIVLVMIFGGVVVAAVPLAVAIVGVSATLLVLLGISTVTDVGEYSLNIVSLLGVGLAVDYALLIVSRYREELASGAEPATAVETAMARAGRAVALAGLAVVAALAGLAAFAEPLLASMAVGGAAVGLLTVALALTLVPALIAIIGRRIPPAPSRRARLSILVRLAGAAQRRPAMVAAVTTLGLLALAAPAVQANFANSDVRALPASSEERRAYETYQRLFSADPEAVTVVAVTAAESPALRDYLDQLNQLPQVSRLDLRPDVPPGFVIIDLIPDGAAAGDEAQALTTWIRETGAPFPLEVTGPAAEIIDYADSVGARLPFAAAAVVLAMFVLLYALTRSLILPIKAILLSVATLAATIGVLVATFQWGWGEPLLRFDSWGAIDLTTPLLLFVFVFGVTTDYEVFLLARIAEENEHRLGTTRAVLAGIERSGPVVTAAATCIVIVFLGFAAGGLVAVKEIGVGMAVAVILDVTVVRGLLLPATMALLGRWNWWPAGRRPPSGPGAVSGEPVVNPLAAENRTVVGNRPDLASRG